MTAPKTRDQRIMSVLRGTSRAEAMLRQLGGEGAGLGELIDVVEDRRLRDDLHQLRMLRNQLAHEAHKTVSDAPLDDAEQRIRRALPQLEAMVRAHGLRPEGDDLEREARAARKRANQEEQLRARVKKSQRVEELRKLVEAGTATAKQRAIVEKADTEFERLKPFMPPEPRHSSGCGGMILLALIIGLPILLLFRACS